MISILIPTFNDVCTGLVHDLVVQARATNGLEWEVLVADDASTDRSVVEANQEIGTIEGCRFIRRATNTGRSVIRNFLAGEARGEWLLFIDADRTVVRNDYLASYLRATQEAQVVYGGYQVLQGPTGNLRYLYEKKAEPSHSVDKRMRHPYHDFNASNFMIRRDVFLRHPFDSRFCKYGYEDVLLGKELAEAGIPVTHIDAPIGFSRYEDNEQFVRKTEEALDTLQQFHTCLKGYSSLLTVADRLQGTLAGTLFCRLYLHRKKQWRGNLTSASPRLLLFKLYKLGYFMTSGLR